MRQKKSNLISKVSTSSVFNEKYIMHGHSDYLGEVSPINFLLIYIGKSFYSKTLLM